MSTQNAVGMGQELLDVPFPEMIKGMGTAIGEAQFELDMLSTRLAQMMSGADYEVEEYDASAQKMKMVTRDGLKVAFDGEELSLLELGFTPNFYQFVDTIIEVKMSISMSRENSSSQSRTDVKAKGSVSMGFFSASASMNVSTVSSSYSSKYQYSAEGASLMRTKLVPVPPPSILQKRINKILEREQQQ